MLTAALAAAGFAATGGCSSKGSGAPKVEPGKPAGDVREVTGAVTATRSGEKRVLAVGDEVSGDDVIETGPDGSIVIELRHNEVEWSLGPGQKKQVAESAAWKAPKGGKGSTDERSTAAGRHAEREAAETAETAVATADEAPAAPGAAAPAPAAVIRQAPGEPQELDEVGGTGTAHALDEGKMGKKDSDRADGPYKMKEKVDDREMPESILEVSVDGGLSMAVVSDVLTHYWAVLETACGATTIKLTISKSGKVTSISGDGADNECLKSEADALVFPTAKSETHATATAHWPAP